MTDTPPDPQEAVDVVYVGAAPRHFPTLGLTVAPGDACQIPAGTAAELADLFAAPEAAKPSRRPKPTTEGEED